MSNGKDDKILEIVTHILDKLQDQQKQQDKLWSQIKDFVGGLANFIQVAGWVVPAASTLAGLLKSFGSDSAGQVDLVKQLQVQFDRVVRDLHEDFEMLHIAEILARAQTGLENIQDAPKLPPNVFDPGDDLNRVTDAKNTLTSRQFWTRPFIPGAVFTVPRDATIALAIWFSATPPLEPDQHRVFDPTLALPALLTAIRIYSEATTALASIPDGGPLPQPWKDHLNELATQLDSFHKEITRGIVDLRVPSLAEITPHPDLPLRSFFEEFGSPVGAAFLYSDRNIVDVYPVAQDFPRHPPGLPSIDDLKEQYPLFLGRFKLGNMARRKALYIVLNLHETWELIQHLRRLAQRTPDFVEPFNGWSVSEIAKALEDSFPRDPNERKIVSVSRNVMSNLRKLVVPRIEGDLGLRALLARVTP
jgi:hypothetical protein